MAAVSEQLGRTEEALTTIKGLLDGETVDFDRRHFRAKRSRLYLDLEHRPPIYMSAFGPRAAESAGRLADGVWTLADTRKAPEVIAAHRRSAEAPGRNLARSSCRLASWAPDDEASKRHANGRERSSRRTTKARIRSRGSRRAG